MGYVCVMFSSVNYVGIFFVQSTQYKTNFPMGTFKVIIIKPLFRLLKYILLIDLDIA